MTKQITYKEFFARYPNDDSCLDHLMRVRYGEKHECGGCGRQARYYRIKARQCYSCEHCGYQVYPKAGTPFEKSRTSLQSWFFAMFLFCASRNGVSAKELERQLGVTYKTAWRMARLIRGYMTQIDAGAQIGGAGAIVEADHGFIGGKDKRGHDDKTTVLGMAERGGEIVLKVVPDRRETTVAMAITENVKPGTNIATDEEPSFNRLREYGYAHGVVNKSKKQYAQDDVHTNTVEAFWNLFKGAYKGTYIYISPKYLPLYLGEFQYRWNLRHDPALLLPVLLHAFAVPSRRASSCAKDHRNV